MCQCGRKFVTIAILIFGCALPSASPAGDWPQFRGPRGDGRADAERLPVSWGGLFEPAKWQIEIPGRGWSSPVVVSDRVWVTSAESTALDEAALENKLAHHPYGRSEFQTHAAVTLLAIELDVETGRILRSIPLLTVDDPPPIHATNSYASPTPVTDGQTLFCHFGSLGTVALSLDDGRVLWSRNFVLDDITGPGSSPILCDNLLVLACDGVDQQFVVALDKLTGRELWRTPRPPIATEDGKHHRAFSTPLLIEHEGRRQIVAPGAQWVVSYEPHSGRELWRVDCGAGMHAAVPRPVFEQGVVYVCTGFMKPQLWAIRVDGLGDVTQSHVIWKYTRQVPTLASPVVAGPQLYFVSEGGILSCLDRNTAALRWQQRLDGSFAASPLLAGGRLYLSSCEGVTYVIEPGPEYNEVARNTLRGHVKASLALAGEALLIRADPTLYCVAVESPE